jgi:hypothetical protein
MLCWQYQQREPLAALLQGNQHVDQGWQLPQALW